MRKRASFIEYQLACGLSYNKRLINIRDVNLCFESFLRVSFTIIVISIVDFIRRWRLVPVIKRLLGKKIVDLYYGESSYNQANPPTHDNEEVLCIEVRPSPIHSDQITRKEMNGEHYVCKQIVMKLADEKSEILVQLISHPACEFSLEVKSSAGTSTTKTRFLS